MQKHHALAFSLFILTATLSIILTLFTFRFFSKSLGLASPLPSFLTGFNNNQVSTLNLWNPTFNKVLGEKTIMPEITARGAITYDLTTNRILFEKNAHEKLSMASLTKIMTAIVALENQKKNDKYIVGSADLVGEDVMGLTEGEILNLRELLFGLILHSGNDAAETIASNFPKGRSAFIKAMNDKAEALGLKNTNFTNPSGLEEQGKQYSTVYDLLVITRYALLNFSLFREVVSTFDYVIPATSTHKAFYLENETNLLTSYPGVRGVKTGYTPQAGLCIVTYLENSGHRIIGILLNSGNRRQEMKDLLDYSLRLLGVEPPEHS